MNVNDDSIVLDLPGIEPIIKRINEEYVDSGLTYGWKSINKDNDYGHWNKHILKAYKHCLFDNASLPFIDKHPDVKLLWEIIQSRIGKRKLLRVYINGYTYGTDAYFHKDDEWINKQYGSEILTETAIVYLNDTWDKDWCGETVILGDDEEIEKSVLPKQNRILIFNGNKFHSARPLTRICPELRKVLVFKSFKYETKCPEMDAIHKLLKNDFPLLKHSYKIAGMLEDRNQSKSVVLAGLYHAIYRGRGTDNRQFVIDRIGEYAEKLVYEYYTLEDRINSLLENKREYKSSMLLDLLNIQFVDLLRFHKYNGQREGDKLEKLYDKIEQLEKELGKKDD